LIGEVFSRAPLLVFSVVSVRGVPVSVRGDRGGGALVPALHLSYRDVEELLAERGIDMSSRQRVPVGAAVDAVAGRRGPVRPPRAG
jgi:hypothetical protein